MSVPVKNPDGFSLDRSDSPYASCEESCSPPPPGDVALRIRTETIYQQSGLSRTSTDFRSTIGSQNPGQPEGPADAASGIRRIFHRISQSNVHVSREGALLIAKTVAIAATASIGAGSLGVPFRIFFPPVIIGGLCGYGTAAFRTQWDVCHRIAAAVALPVAFVTLGPSIGPIGVAALSVAAGSWGPEACMKVATAVEKLFHWAQDVRWPCERSA